jgi:hypothetical protein
MKIGYSAWGYVGDGELDSPDGGRLTRSLFLSRLIDTGYDIVWLQKNRDVDTNGNKLFCEDKIGSYPANREKVSLCKLQYAQPSSVIQEEKFPEIDLLFVEWRWPIWGRNALITGQMKDDKKWTPDLDRQNELLEYYGRNTEIKIIIWDKDEKMTKYDESRMATVIRDKLTQRNRRITVLSPALKPQSNIYIRKTLLFPCDLKTIVGTKVNKQIQHLIGYVGSQYERDEQVYKYINPFSFKYPEQVIFAGNWMKYEKTAQHNSANFPCIKFVDRVLPKDMWKVYRFCLASLLMCKKNYAEHVHITQRIHEVAANGVVALGVSEQTKILDPDVALSYDGFGVDQFVGAENIVSDAYDLINRIEYLKALTVEKRQIILDQQIDHLKPFDIENVLIEFEKIISTKTDTISDDDCIYCGGTGKIWFGERGESDPPCTFCKGTGKTL